MGQKNNKFWYSRFTVVTSIYSRGKRQQEKWRHFVSMTFCRIAKQTEEIALDSRLRNLAQTWSLNYKNCPYILSLNFFPRILLMMI